MSSERERIFQIWGWLLFVVGVIFFILASIEARSLTTFIGSVLFLIGCIVFMVPLVRPKR